MLTKAVVRGFAELSVPKYESGFSGLFWLKCCKLNYTLLSSNSNVNINCVPDSVVSAQTLNFMWINFMCNPFANYDMKQKNKCF